MRFIQHQCPPTNNSCARMHLGNIIFLIHMAHVKCEHVQQCIPLRTSKRHVYISFYASLPDCGHEQQHGWKINGARVKTHPLPECILVEGSP